MLLSLTTFFLKLPNILFSLSLKNEMRSLTLKSYLSWKKLHKVRAEIRPKDEVNTKNHCLSILLSKSKFIKIIRISIGMDRTKPVYAYAKPLLLCLTKSGINGTVKLTEHITNAND